MKPFFSAIIPAYNPQPQFFHSLLVSIFMQQCDDVEIIIVDDGSTTNTIEEILSELSINGFDVKIIKQKQNKGVAHAINTGILAANGTYCVVSGDDDLYIPGTFLFIQSQLEDLLSSPEVAGGYVGLINIPEQFTLEEVIKYYSLLAQKKSYFSRVNFLTFPEGPGFATHQVYLKTSVAQKCLYRTDIRYGGDHHYWLRLLRNGYEFIYLNRQGAVYRQRKKSISHYHVFEGISTRLQIDKAIYEEMKEEDIIPQAPFIYRNSISYYKKTTSDILKIANWAGYARALGNMEEYNQILSLLPKENINFIPIESLKNAVYGGIKRCLALDHLEINTEKLTLTKEFAFIVKETVSDIKLKYFIGNEEKNEIKS